MDASEFDAYCRSFSGAEQKSLFGPNVNCWVVGDRIFAMMAEGADSISIRCPNEKAAQILVEHGRAGKLPNLPHGGWIALKLSEDAFDVKSRIKDSFDMARAGTD